LFEKKNLSVFQISLGNYEHKITRT